MKKIKIYLIIYVVMFLSQLSFGLRDYQLDKVLRTGLGNPNHFGLAYNPSSDHLFLGRGSDGNGYLTEIDMDGNVVNNRQLPGHIRDLSFDHTTGHLFAVINVAGVQRIWEMGTDMQTFYNDISLQTVMKTSAYQGFSGLQVGSDGLWISNWFSQVVHLSWNYEVLETIDTPLRLESLAASPDGGFLAMEYDIFAGEKDLYEFNSLFDHISTTPACATYELPTRFGMTNIEAYQDKLFLSNNTEIYLLSTTVPEPATLSLLAFGGLALLRKRK